MNDILPILQESLIYFAQRNAHFFFGPTLLRILSTKFINAQQLCMLHADDEWYI